MSRRADVVPCVTRSSRPAIDARKTDGNSRKISARARPLAAAMSLAFALCGNAAQAQATDLPPVVVSGKLPAPAADVTGFGRRPARALAVRRRSVHGAEQIEGRRRAAPGRHHAQSTHRSATPTTPKATGTSAQRARLRARQPLQLPARGPADQRRDLDPARQQGAHRDAARARAASRPAPARRAASSTTSSSGPTTSSAARCCSAGAARRACSARSIWARASASTRPSACGSTPPPSTSTPSCATARGERHLFALAGDWRVGADTLLEAEIESSHRSQPSQPGFSLLGSRVPDARRSTRA